LRALALEASPAAAARADKPDVESILRRRRAAGDGLAVLNEADSKALLHAYGIAAPRERIATNVEDAVRAAKDVGYPVVLKVLSAEVAHKSDIGGVILGVTGDDELRAAYARLAQNLANARPGAALEQV